MSKFCQDRDMLGIEPIVFIGGGFVNQEMASGSDGQIAGTTFSSASSDFVTAGVAAGMVLCTYTNSPAEGTALEILSVDSATSLTVSVLRADADGPATPPQAGTALSFRIRTFAPQIHNASAAMAEKLRQMAEAPGISVADFADSAQLRIATAFLTLANVFYARAENSQAHDANWIKAEHYKSEHLKLQLQLRLAVDADGDGVAEQNRTLGNVTLRRS